MSCCKIVKNHIDEVKRIVDTAKKNCQNIDVQKFRSIPICSIKTPDGVTPLSLNDIEKNTPMTSLIGIRNFNVSQKDQSSMTPYSKKNPPLGSLILKTERRNLKRRLESYQKFHLLQKMKVEKKSLNVY